MVDVEQEKERSQQQPQQHHKKPANINYTSAQPGNQTKKGYSNKTKSPPKPQPKLSTTPCPFCSTSHEVANCQLLGTKSVDQRVKMLMDKQLCFHCFQPNHTARTCENRPRCDTCNGRHATLLHGRTFEERPARSRLSADSVPFRPFRQQGDAQQQPSTNASNVDPASNDAAPSAPML